MSSCSLQNWNVAKRLRDSVSNGHQQTLIKGDLRSDIHMLQRVPRVT